MIDLLKQNWTLKKSRVLWSCHGGGIQIEFSVCHHTKPTLWTLLSLRYDFTLFSRKWNLQFLHFVQRCILDIDVQGARSVRASSLEAIFIFICPPSMNELEKRLRDRWVIVCYLCSFTLKIIPQCWSLKTSNHDVLCRGTETEEQVLKRLRNAQAEIEQGMSSGIFDHILYNDNLQDCYENLKVTT